jgi:hypothetical protein
MTCTRDVAGNRAVKIVEKQAQNEIIIQRRVTIFCVNQNSNHVLIAWV